MLPVCHIVGALPLSAPPAVRRGDLLIAADGGYRALKENGLSPDLCIGDFDSAPRPDGDNVLVFPTHKDDTDMLLAVKEGLLRGHRRFCLYGGVGGRLDHTVANFVTLAYLAEKGASGILIGGAENIAFLPCGQRLAFSAPRKDALFSAFPYGGDGVADLAGFAYGGKDVAFSSRFPLGVSNAFLGGDASFFAKKGDFLIITEEKIPFPS